jgi:hypothetical protein
MNRLTAKYVSSVWSKAVSIFHTVWSGICRFLNSKFVLLVVGFALTTVVGHILNTQYNNLAWSREAALRMKLARFEAERKVVFDYVEALTAYQVADQELFKSYNNLMGRLQPSREERLLDFVAQKSILDQARQCVLLTMRFAHPLIMDKYSPRAQFLFSGNGSKTMGLYDLINENHEKLFLIGWDYGAFRTNRKHADKAAKQARHEMIALTNRISSISAELVRNLFSDQLSDEGWSENGQRHKQNVEPWWAHWWAL